MGKKGSIIVLMVLISGLILLVLVLQRGRKNIFTDPYKVVSPDACLVVETSDLAGLLNSFSGGNRLFRELSTVKELKNFTGKVKFLADLAAGNEYKPLSGSTALISFHLTNDGKLSPLLSMSVPPDFRFRHIRNIIHTTRKGEIIIKKKGTVKVIEVPYTYVDHHDTVYVSFISGLLICSSSGQLVDEAIRQKDVETDIRANPGFLKIMAASGKKEDKLFVIFDNISGIVQTLSREKSSKLTESVAHFAGSAEGDIYFTEDGIILSGYAESTDSMELLYKFKTYSPGSFETYRVLPSATVLFETILLPKIDTGQTRDSLISDPAFIFAQKIKPVIGEEITRATIDIRDNKVTENSVVVYELKNRDEAEQLLTQSLTAWKSDQQLKENNYIQYFQPDDQTKVPVYSTPFKGLITILVPGFAPSVKDSLFTFYDNFLITGSSYVTLSRILYDNLLNKTLINDLTFRDFESSLPSRAGYFFYCIPSRIIDYMSGFFNEEITRALNSNINSLKKIQAAGYQFAASNGMIYNTISVRFKEEIPEDTGTEWETLLDTTAAIKPFFFTNHNTGAKEIFIQDLKNNAYLINSAGRVLWKVHIGERIYGNIYMIDYYRNNKYQLLFSGKNFIHLLDRNGNDIEKFPVKLRSPASGPIALFDYDGNHEYRLLIAGEDKLIYAYDKSANTVKGWTPFKTIGNVRTEIKFFRVSGKDFLVVSDESYVYFLDRRGSIKLRLNEPVTRASGSEIRLTSGNDQTLVFTDTVGTLQFISFGGTVQKISLRKFSGDHSFDFFDVDGDGFGEYVFIDRGILYLYDHDKSEIFTRDFGSEEMEGPINFIFSASDRKIGVYDDRKKLIYLINKNGDDMNGFPLKGASVFSIGKLSEKSGFHLIVGGNDSFLYNYALNLESK